LFVEHTCTVTSRVVSSTSPHVGQLALIVAIRGLRPIRRTQIHRPLGVPG